MRARRAGALVLVAAIAAAACRKPPEDPLKLERNLLTVDNRTDRDWNKVEISVNRAFRIMVPTIKARSRFQAPLDTFVAGFGQRFDFRRIQIRDLRLTA